MLVLFLFFCSGATALIYEVLWSKYLALILGSTVQAQTVVLAVFMGGLALGNRIFGARSASIANPVLAYAILEFIIGIYAFFFSHLYKAGDFLFVGIGSSIANTGVLLLFLKLLISAGLLLLPTIMMGGTLPLIATWIQKQPGIESGARVGIFYAVNSLGAVFGAGLAGFTLVQNLGLVSSLELTGIANVAVALVALILSKREALAEEVRLERNERPEPGMAPAPVPLPAAAPVHFGLLVAFTGAVSMGLEVLYARALALIVGGSLQAFALVLMSFILGIGLGSVLISSLQAARKYGLGTIYFLLLAAAGIVVTNVIFIENWTILYSQAKYGLALNASGYLWHQIAVAVLAFTVLGLPAAFLGAVVPLSIRLIEGGGRTLGDQVGRLLTFNTIGAVTGVLLTGFFLMPLLGLRGAMTTLALALFAVTCFIAFKRQHPRMVMGTVIMGLVAVLGISVTGDNWQEVIGSGVFRLRNQYVTRDWMENRKRRSELLFYKDSADATVSVERTEEGERSQITLRINGKTDASSVGDLSTQFLLAHLPMMAKPDAKKAFVLGFGSGITAGALLGHPVEQITIAENCQPVLDASYLFEKWNRGVLTNSRTRLFKDDARAVLKLNPDKYDIIISEPSNPWVAGIGSVFSKEFYELAASRLTEGGIMAQWFHQYEMSDNIVLMVLRTFGTVFPHVELWDSQAGDIVLLGSMKPWESSPAQYQKVYDRPGPRGDLSDVGMASAVSVWMRQIASQKTGFAIPGDGPVQTDEFPLLEYHAPRAFFMGSQANLLFTFDERTMQFQLSNREKLKVLRALPDRVLLDAFSYFGSSNPDLRLYYSVLVARAQGDIPRIDPMGLIGFRKPEEFPEKPHVRTNATPQYVELVQIEANILRDDTKWKEGCARIEQILGAMIEADNLRPADFSPPYYAATAVRYGIAFEDYAMALRVLRLGFVFNSQDPQLLYLSRVMDRLVDPETVRQITQARPPAAATNAAPGSTSNQPLKIFRE